MAIPLTFTMEHAALGRKMSEVQTRRSSDIRQNSHIASQHQDSKIKYELIKAIDIT